MKRFKALASLGAMAFLSACSGKSAPAYSTPVAQAGPQQGPTDPAFQRTYSIDALVYNGPGAAAVDAEALTDIVKSRGLTYELADAAKLNRMSIEDLRKFGVIIWPGGGSQSASRSLTPETRRNIRDAVQKYGVGYSGYCAGAWMAVGPGPEIPVKNWHDPGELQDFGIGIVPGDVLQEFYPNGNRSHDSPAIVSVSLADGSKRDLIFYGGAIMPELPQGVVGRYNDGTPAIIQTWAGNGFVTLSAVHPEAPAAWAQGLNDSDGVEGDKALGWALIEAALRQRAMSSF